MVCSSSNQRMFTYLATGVINLLMFSLSLVRPPTYWLYLSREEEKSVHNTEATLCKLKEKQRLFNQMVSTMFEKKVLFLTVSFTFMANQSDAPRLHEDRKLGVDEA